MGGNFACSADRGVIRWKNRDVFRNEAGPISPSVLIPSTITVCKQRKLVKRLCSQQLCKSTVILLYKLDIALQRLQIFVLGTGLDMIELQRQPFGFDPQFFISVGVVVAIAGVLHSGSGFIILIRSVRLIGLALVGCLKIRSEDKIAGVSHSTGGGGLYALQHQCGQP